MANRDYEGRGGGSPEAAVNASADGSERGAPASYDPKSGEVHGSGSDAGAGGPGSEDYDGDPMAGAGREPVGDARPASEGVERPIDPDEGI